MSMISWIDNRTLLGCQILLGGVFAFVFLGMKQMYPRLRGAGTFALGFCCAMLGCALLSHAAIFPIWLSVVLAKPSSFLPLPCFTRNASLLSEPAQDLFLWPIVAISTLLQAYFTVIDEVLFPASLLPR